MSCESEILASVAAAVAADTGASGLTNTSSTANCPTQFRVDDPNGERTNSNWPAISWEVPNISAMDAFGAGAYMCELRFHVKTDQDTQFANHDAVVQRVRAVFHRQSLSAGSVFGFGTVRIVGVRRLAVIANKELHTVIDCRVVARTNTGL